MNIGFKQARGKTHRSDGKEDQYPPFPSPDSSSLIHHCILIIITLNIILMHGYNHCHRHLSHNYHPHQ